MTILLIEGELLTVLDAVEEVHLAGFRIRKFVDDVLNIWYGAFEAFVNLSVGSFEIRNLSDKLEAILYSLWNADVTISGSEDEIADVTVSDLGLYIDVADCNEGTYTRQMMYQYDGPVKVSAGSVMVRLSAKEEYE